MDIQELKPTVEALIFCSPSPVKLNKIQEIVKTEKQKIVKTIEQLNEDYKKSGRSFTIRKIAGGFQFYALAEFSPYIKELKKTKPIVLSTPALETLAMIAYRQPITRPEIERTRGVESKGVIRNLLEKDLIKVAGRKDIPGKPILYKTTDFFLKHFGLNSISELPKIDELTVEHSSLKLEVTNGH